MILHGLVFGQEFAMAPNSNNLLLGGIMSIHKSSADNLLRIPHHFIPEKTSVEICTERCLQTYKQCQELIVHCLQLGGVHAEVEHIRLLQDCSAITALNAKFILRESDFHKELCALCEEICTACAKDCEKFDDEMMRTCAHNCRLCAESCKTVHLSH